MVTQRAYRRWRVIVLLTLIGAVIIADHIGSPTFRQNLGEGGLHTTLNQRQNQTTACAPCGAPCPSTRQND
jgi:hypothetical protein